MVLETDAVQQNTNRRHFAYKPNLVVVDGGKPQVMAAAKALADCGVDDVAVCGLAKRLEEVWVPDDDYPIILKRQSEGMYLLQRVRDESHRFAITYHRQTRRKGALRSRFGRHSRHRRSSSETASQPFSAPYAPCVRRAWRISNRSASAMPRPRTFTRHCIRPLTLLRRRRMPSEQ